MLNYSVQCLDIASYYVNYKIICKTILPVNQGTIQKIFYKNMTRSATLKINCTTINIIVKTTEIFTLQTFFVWPPQDRWPLDTNMVCSICSPFSVASKTQINFLIEILNS